MPANGRRHEKLGVNRLALHCAANWPRTSLHAGESEAAWVARQRTIRPPPGASPPHSERTSPPHADRSTRSSSRGRIGRSTSAGAAGAAPGLAAAALGAAELGAVDFEVAVFGAVAAGSTGLAVVVAAGVESGLASGFASALGSAGASTARTAVWQPGARLDMFFCRHCSDASPPGGMLEQCAM